MQIKGVPLPSPPSDLRQCFKGKVTQPQNKEELLALSAQLKISDDKKSVCGMRLICWFEDVKRGYEKSEAPRSTDCKSFTVATM